MKKISLRAARVNTGLRQTDVAVKLNVSAKTVGNWESGKSHPRGTALIKLCEIYGVDLDSIILPE